MRPEPLQILSSAQNHGYLPLPIPAPRDAEIDDLLASTPVSALAAEEHWPVLRAYAERMASLAVRERDPEILRRGLVALGLAGLGQGSADALTELPLFHDGAERIGEDAGRLFRSVGAELGGAVEAAVEAFLARSPEDRSLDAMGYRAGHDAGGFRYQRTW